MNIIEAAKSGKRFKRANWEEFYLENSDFKYVEIKDISADDWEVEEKKVEVTRDDLHMAVKNAEGDYSKGSCSYFELIAKELGL